jgi:hypothetical protein
MMRDGDVYVAAWQEGITTIKVSIYTEGAERITAFLAVPMKA